MIAQLSMQLSIKVKYLQFQHVGNFLKFPGQADTSTVPELLIEQKVWIFY